MDDFVYHLSSSSVDGFGIDYIWQTKLRERGLMCNACNTLCSTRVTEIDRVIVRNKKPPQTPIGLIGKLRHNEVMSKRLITAIGEDLVETLGPQVPIIDSTGEEYKDFSCFLFDESKLCGIARGLNPLNPKLCKVCNSLYYWPGWPYSNWYILRRDWPSHTELLYLGGLMCSRNLWEERIQPKQIPELIAHKICIFDDPADGWPADYRAMKAEMSRRKLFR